MSRKFLYNILLSLSLKGGLKKRELYVKFTIKTKNEFNS